MTKKEMAAELRRRKCWTPLWMSKDGIVAEEAIYEAAAAALEREAAVEAEKERPSISLKDQAEWAMRARNIACAGNGWTAGSFADDAVQAASQTLARLREDGGKLLKRFDDGDLPLISSFVALLRALGVTPT